MKNVTIDFHGCSMVFFTLHSIKFLKFSSIQFSTRGCRLLKNDVKY
jgi:hypothetical protein